MNMTNIWNEGGLPGSDLSKDNETLPKGLDLPARSAALRDEGRAATFEVVT